MEKAEAYKGFKIYATEVAVSVSESGMWLAISFDTVETAKCFLDLKNKFEDNFYTVISDCQKKAIEQNKGLVSMSVVKNIPLSNTKSK